MICATETPIERVLSKLENVEMEHEGQWNARCPSHDDCRNSLSVGLASDGRVLIKCLAGCLSESVVSAINMSMADLFPPRNGYSTAANPKEEFTKGKANGKTSKRKLGPIEATYDYVDEDGNLLFQVVRHRDPKDFTQRSPNPGGGWQWSVKGVRNVLFRLQKIIAASSSATIFYVEGEKDVIALEQLGLTATTNRGGASKAKSDTLDVLTGKNVAIIGDNDEAGRQHAQDVRQKLAGRAASVKIIQLDGLPEKGDVSDWIAAGGTRDELMRIVRDTAEPETDEIPREAPINEIASPEWCDHSDLGNARLFVKMHGRRVRFCHPWGKWIVWDGKRWAVDESGAIERLAKDVSDHRWKEAREGKADEDGMRFAVKSANAERISAMLKLARSEPGVPVMPAEFDRDHWLLNCSNGTIDLRTGELRPHRQSDLITKLCPTAYKPEAGSYSWDCFLEAIFDGRQSLVDFCRRYFGYSITGSVREQILLILWGCGSNGKSTLLNALMDTIGSDFTLKAVADLLLVKQNESHPTERADLFGKRFVVCVETGDGRGLNEALVKELTGGDRIRARRLYEDFWEFVPTHKPALCTNHKPRVRGTDHAIWRRLALLPFGVQFWNPDKGESGPDGLQQDKSLPEKLTAEAEGILAWLVRGCLEWQRDGLMMPPEVMLATAEYQQQQDSIGTFISDRCLLADGIKIRASALYTAYREWSEEMGEHPLGQRKFGEAMTAKGFERLESAGIWYCGITTS